MGRPGPFRFGWAACHHGGRSTWNHDPVPRPLLPLLLAALIAGACSSAGPTLVAADQPATPAPTGTPTIAETETGAGDSAVTTDETETTPGHADEGADDEADAATDATADPDADAGGDDDGDTGADDEADLSDNGGPAGPATVDCTTPRAGPATNELSQAIDFDFDDAPDLVSTYAVSGDNRLAFRLRVETAAGETLDAALDVDRAMVGPVEPLGAADIDSDNDATELLTVVGAGASTMLVAIHARQGCDLAQATLDDFPITFPIGGSIGNTAGLQCIDADNNGTIDSFVAWVGVANFDTDEGDYFIDGVEYQLRDGTLRQIGTRTFEANIREADFVYGQLSCGDVNA